ncbi:MAG TPA: hypothetical protein VF516_28155 [Kofleriaceae bacterium]
MTPPRCKCAVGGERMWHKPDFGISYANYEYSFPVTPRASPSGDMFGGTFAETNPTGRNLDTAGWSVKILESVAPGEPSTPGSE